MYPVMIDLRHQRCLVVGGGRIAARKAAGLVAAGAHVAVVAPEACTEITEMEAVRWLPRPYERGEVAAYRLAITATGDPEVDGQVYRDGEAAGILVNSADDPDRCRFILPAVTRRGDLVVATSTSGRSPAMATWLRRRFDEWVDDDLLRLLEIAAAVRHEVREVHGTSELHGWQEALDDGLLELVAEGRGLEATERLRLRLGLGSVTA